MARVRRTWKVPVAAVAGAALALVLLFGTGALGQSNAQPANKVIASGRKITQVPPGPTTGIGTSANTILSGSMKTSKPEDLILNVSLECSILTDVTAPGGPETTMSSGNAQGQIRVWVVVDNSYIVPIQDMSAPPQNTHGVGNDSDKVTFCNREHRIAVTDTEGDGDGTDTVQSYINTKDANAFEWVALNLGSGTHTIEVRADLTTDASEGSVASGYVGNRTLVVEPTKLANNAVIA